MVISIIINVCIIRKQNPEHKADLESKKRYHPTSIRIGNVPNIIWPLEGWLEHLRRAILEMYRIADAARLRVGKWLRSINLEKIEQAEFDAAIRSSFYAAAFDGLPAEMRNLANSQLIEEYVRLNMGNIKTLSKNNFGRVLQKRFRRILAVLDEESVSHFKFGKLRPLYHMVKLVLGPTGKWVKGN